MSDTVRSPTPGGGAPSAGVSLGKGSRPSTVLTPKQKSTLDGIVSGSEPADVKIAKLKDLYIQQVKQTRRAKSAYAAVNQHTKQLLAERDALNKALESTSTMNTRLENLCRELQKQHGVVTAENKRIMTQEQANRKELADKFQNSIEDIKKQLDVEKERQQAETDQLRAQLKSSLEQYELREKHFDKLLQTKVLEKQLAEAQAAQQLQAHKADLLAANERHQGALAIEMELRKQLQMYSGKFKEFQEAMTGSNAMFETLKKELDQGNKARRKLQKQVAHLTAKEQKSDIALVTMKEELERTRKSCASFKEKNARLQGLCREMAKQRTEALASLAAATESTAEGDADASAPAESAGQVSADDVDVAVAGGDEPAGAGEEVAGSDDAE